MVNNAKIQGKIGVLIEEHFDEIEFRAFNSFFPKNGYEIEYISHIWNQDKLTFKGVELIEEVTVTVEVNDIEPTDYKGIILIGAYAMDRLRYEEYPKQGQPNQSPAVRFLRKAVKAMDAGKLNIGTICHSLWLLCADPELLKNREVTCAHNILCDVQNAGGIIIFDGDGTKNLHIDGNLITAKHPNVVAEFMEVFLKAINEQRLQVANR
ncbi:DJ-1/PfpI family protein [Nostoc sp. UCD121]|uniref:DJ-1/PfpI family protein n=1 Tax=unclassified Nostoc TaxID=2593658 RepID=UPI001627B853|nr:MULTISPECIES: DJ-1/PfpI family protein [unclassified Nostoc]MBC1223964.1 DJ-1/PfpI family protein [Nostoc sp. UCD120]MBC1277286.1 DJ-1/PfpI family protein [Nostoc sp. UCD121]MBC1294017.1 DJ-1/PfpI family protein [Nostoc sp. UCD122]